jgi:hypothetical protein
MTNFFNHASFLPLQQFYLNNLVVVGCLEEIAYKQRTWHRNIRMIVSKGNENKIPVVSF